MENIQSTPKLCFDLLNRKSGTYPFHFLGLSDAEVERMDLAQVFYYFERIRKSVDVAERRLRKKKAMPKEYIIQDRLN